MEEKVLSLKTRIMQHPLLKKENLNPKAWINSEQVKDFTDFILQKEQEADTDFDNVEMCKYKLEWRTHWMVVFKTLVISIVTSFISILVMGKV